MLAACESPQDPEPIRKTLPTAAGIVGVWAAIVLAVLFLSIRWIARRRERALVTTPIAVALLAIVPVALAGAPLVLGLAWIVAFGYQEPTVSLFSWDDTVGIHVFVAGVSVVAILAAASVSLLATHSNRAVVAIGQMALAVPTGAMAATLVAADSAQASLIALLCTAPWAVAFVLSWQQRDPSGRSTDTVSPFSPAPVSPPTRPAPPRSSDGGRRGPPRRSGG